MLHWFLAFRLLVLSPMYDYHMEFLACSLGHFKAYDVGINDVYAKECFTFEVACE